jgi:predicted metallopeptidase
MIRFIYSVGTVDRDREKVIVRVCEKAKHHIKLPETIEILFKYLDLNVYAETIIEHRFKNRIHINNNLSAKEVIRPLVHELIHLNQTHTEMLQSNGRGICIWKGTRYSINNTIPDYNDYCNLPWEIDAIEREPELLRLVLEN